MLADIKLGIFRRVRKIAKSDYLFRHVCLSVCPSAWNNSASTGRIFMKSDVWVFFENMSRKFKFHSNRTIITVTVHGGQNAFLIYLAPFFLEWEIFQVTVVKKIKSHILHSIMFMR